MLSSWQVGTRSQEKTSSLQSIAIYLGFDHEFNSLQSKEDEFSIAFGSLVAGERVNISVSLGHQTDPDEKSLELVRVLFSLTSRMTRCNDPVK